MMRTPINTELQHINPGYDPAKAHDYYEKHKHLKGRKKGAAQPAGLKYNASPTKAKQKAALQNSINNLQAQLGKLEALIKEKEAIVKKNQARAKVKARQKDKPATAADKAKAARENEKYRKKHKTELKTKAKQANNKAGGSKAKANSQKPSDMSIANLKALATKVKGQLAVAKQKLAAL